MVVIGYTMVTQPVGMDVLRIGCCAARIHILRPAKCRCGASLIVTTSGERLKSPNTSAVSFSQRIRTVMKRPLPITVGPIGLKKLFSVPSTARHADSPMAKHPPISKQ